MAGKHFLGDGFKGVYSSNEIKQVWNTMNNGDIIILNNQPNYMGGQHWLLFIKHNHKMYGYDSYGFNIRLLSPDFNNLHIIQDRKDGEQALKDRNCGQRCVASAMIYKKYGIQNFLKI